MMTWISSEYFARSPVLVLPLIALFVFMAVFVVSTVRAVLTGRDQVERMARLPLDEQEGVSRG